MLLKVAQATSHASIVEQTVSDGIREGNDEQHDWASERFPARLHRRPSKAGASESLDVQRPRRYGAAFSTEGIAMLIIRKQPRHQDTPAERESRAAAHEAHKEIQREKMIDYDMEQAYQEVTQ